MSLPETLQSNPDAVALAKSHRDAILGGKFDRQEWTIDIAAASIVPACDFLRAERGYTFLADLTAYDSYPVEPRFSVVYQLYNVTTHQFLRLKVHVGAEAEETPAVDTVTVVWPNANWHERELFDLFGIRFNGHPDLRRILMPDDWVGYPLRRDYPTEGPR